MRAKNCRFHLYNRIKFSLGGNAAMEALKWFLLGMMVAWTPGLLALALMLRRHHIEQNTDISRHR
jgi:hypothetical protein